MKVAAGYLGIGSSELVNFAHAVSVVQESKYNPNIFEFVHTKLMHRCMAKLTTYIFLTQSA